MKIEIEGFGIANTIREVINGVFYHIANTINHKLKYSQLLGNAKYGRFRIEKYGGEAFYGYKTIIYSIEKYEEDEEPIGHLIIFQFGATFEVLAVVKDYEEYFEIKANDRFEVICNRIAKEIEHW